jgi:3-hydroxyacyl-[acyl-carrier-protein] dehydratase
MKRAIAAAGSELRWEAEGGARVFCLPADFPGFAGHFPGYPVLPAVLQVLAAQVLVEELRGRPLRLAKLERAKFLRPVRPGEPLRVECRPRRGSWEARLAVEGEPAATFAMTLVEEDEG